MDWRSILPMHWLPLVFYFQWLIALRFAVAAIEGRGVGFELELTIDVLHLGACGALVCLAALLQITIGRRILLLLALWVLLCLMDGIALLFDGRALPLGGYLHELARAALADLRLMATLVAVTHATSGLLRFFATSKVPRQENLARAAQSHLADWLFWMTLFAFCFLPSLDEWRPPPEPGEPYDAGRISLIPEEVIYGLMAMIVVGVLFWGLFVLPAGWRWRFRALILSCLFATPLLILGYVIWSIRPNFDGWLFLYSYAYLLFWSLPAIPSWLLLRCAGYRGYSARLRFWQPQSSFTSEAD